MLSSFLFVCQNEKIPCDKRFYRYICIDEATWERFLYWYDEHTPANTIDFVKRCVSYYEYKPIEIQTDNGTEFTWNQEKMTKLHPLDNLCLELDIDHHKIRPRTPRILRSKLEELRNKGKQYLERSNKIPMAVLNYKILLEKRHELIISLLVNYNTFISVLHKI